ncbi:MAG: Erythronolide synthase, partial [Cyanobacteria bacterium RYN_339]|nr:Erythronolide synthase [Cyanobacteria bacterium RYN_339]
MSQPLSPLAIVGMACLFPKADGLNAYWANIKRGVDGITEVPASHWAPDDYFDADPKKADFTYARRGGFLDPVPFDAAAFGIAPNLLEATDASQLLGLVVATEALKNAGYGPERPFDRNRASVVLGVTGTLQLAIPLGARLGHPHWKKALADCGIDPETAQEVMDRIADAYVPWQENSFPGLLGNVVAGRIANKLDLGGTNCVVDAACASSLSAMHLAAMELATGKADMVVTGGVDAFNDIFMYMCFSKTPALSPTGDSRPFSSGADGTILGEGLGMVVLKRLADAERDGDTIHAVLKAIGTSSDGRGKAIYAPSDDGQEKALRAAYAEAGVSPATIELVEGHGTGTKVGDAIELAALARVYREARPEGRWVTLGSVKSQIGHTKAAAGAAGLIKAALALHHKVLPPSIKVERPAEALDGTPFSLNAAPRPWLPRAEHPRRAAVSAFGFGGSNFHAVLEEYQPTKTAPDWDGRVDLLALSADSSPALEQLLERHLGAMTFDERRVACQQARAAFSPTAPHRLVVVLDGADPIQVLQSAKAQLREGRPAWSTPDGAFYGEGPCPGKLAVLFPGQGAQYPGMGRDLGCLFPAALDALTAAEQAFELGSLLDFMIPTTAYDEAGRRAQADELRATDVAQPALGACGLAAWNVLAGFGVAPAAFAGHSYGELAALCAAGRLTGPELHQLSNLRGRLMAGDGGDRGSMLAVRAPLAAIEQLVAEQGLDVVLANKNAPKQGVLSGSTAAIDAAERACAEAGLDTARLVVGAAFHSPLVASAEAPLLEALQSMALAPGAEVYANTTAAPYPADAAEARALLAGQLARPVEWVAQVQAMAAAGVHTFLEIAPGARLTGLVRSVLEDTAHAVVALDASNGKRDGVSDLARALAQLAALGHALDLSSWQGGAEGVRAIVERKPPKMAIPISG